MNRVFWVLCLLVGVCLNVGAATSKDFVELDGGTPDFQRLVLAFEGGGIALELVLNADSLGLGHQGIHLDQSTNGQASTIKLDPKQKQVRADKVAGVVGKLFDVNNIVTIPLAAECVGSSSSAKQETIAGQVMIKTEHALDCLKPEEIDVVEVKIFDLASKLESLEVDLVNQMTKNSSTVSPEKTMVSLGK